METAMFSRTLLRRLPLYLEYLKNLSDESPSVSATAIAAALNMGQVQVRKDLAKIAGEGRCRTGRSRDQLIEAIEAVLSNPSHIASVLIGTGSLGMGLLERCQFTESGINVLACFDLTPALRQTPCGRPIYSIKRLESFCGHYRVSHGIIAVPAEAAQCVCDGLVACGVQSIWNFSSAPLTVPNGVWLQCFDASQPSS